MMAETKEEWHSERVDGKDAHWVDFRHYRSGVTHVDVVYPRQNDFKALGVFLSEVRVANGLWITYDFEKDCWVVTVQCLEGEENPKILLKKIKHDEEPF
jgi:hypothetical protein